MKRCVVVAMLAMFLLCLCGSASASELKVRGLLDMWGMWGANQKDFDSDKADGDHFMADQRMRVWFDFQTSKNLKAVLGLEMNAIWGRPGSGDWTADWGTDATGSMRVKHAYLDFNFPNTKINVKAGLQGIALPATSLFKSPVLEDDAAGLVVSSPVTDNFGLTLGYIRGYDASWNTGSSAGQKDKDDFDMVFVLAPITLNGFKIVPYFDFAMIGENANNGTAGTFHGNSLAGDDSTMWNAGINFAMTAFDPFKLEADIIYGQLDSDDYDSKGWYGALAASYKLDWGTPTLFATYATGADDDSDSDNYMPTIDSLTWGGSHDPSCNWGITPYTGGRRAYRTGNFNWFTGNAGLRDGTGLWMVGGALKNMSFIEGLSHDFTVLYEQGTSDKKAGVYFDEKDSAWDFYFVTRYKIYENLSLNMELAYFVPDFDDRSGEDDSYMGSFGFQYTF